MGSSMEERLRNTGLHAYGININIYVYEEDEMGGACSTLWVDEKLIQNFSRNAWRILKIRLRCGPNSF
jgi:hypothetical protein